MKVKNIKKIITGLVFPERCPGCDGLLEKNEKGFCRRCSGKIRLASGRVCGKCGRPLAGSESYCPECSGEEAHAFHSGRAVYVYEGIIKESMYRFKYSNRRCYARSYADHAMRLHGRWLAQVRPDVILPVPMFEGKKRLRGYNQAEVFARELSRRSGIPFRNDIIIRKENTVPMKGLSRSNRQNNVKNAFLISKSAVQFKKILLVDDIITTGATIDAISGVIGRACDADIYAMYVCVGRDR